MTLAHPVYRLPNNESVCSGTLCCTILHSAYGYQALMKLEHPIDLICAERDFGRSVATAVGELFVSCFEAAP